jgi:hypothetical protein
MRAVIEGVQGKFIGLWEVKYLKTRKLHTYTNEDILHSPSDIVKDI